MRVPYFIDQSTLAGWCGLYRTRHLYFPMLFLVPIVGWMDTGQFFISASVDAGREPMTTRWAGKHHSHSSRNPGCGSLRCRDGSASNQSRPPLSVFENTHQCGKVASCPLFNVIILRFFSTFPFVVHPQQFLAGHIKTNISAYNYKKQITAAQGKNGILLK